MITTHPVSTDPAALPGEVGRDGALPLRAVWLAVAALPLPCGSLSADRAGRFRLTPGVGKLIETILRKDLIICDEVGFAPLDSTGSQLLFRFVAAAYERRGLAIASHWPFEEWGRFLPDRSTAVSLPDLLVDRNNVVATDCESYRMREARSRTAGRLSNR